MIAKITLYSNKTGELNKFLSRFYNTNLDIENSLKWEKESANPVELAEIIGIFVDNSDDYVLNKELGDISLEWKWESVVWEGTKIAERVYDKLVRLSS